MNSLSFITIGITDPSMLSALADALGDYITVIERNQPVRSHPRPSYSHLRITYPTNFRGTPVQIQLPPIELANYTMPLANYTMPLEPAVARRRTLLGPVSAALWGLDRSDQDDLPLSFTYSPPYVERPTSPLCLCLARHRLLCVCSSPR